MRRIGFRTSGLRAYPLQRALRGIAEAGYDSVELCEEHPDARALLGSPSGWRSMVEAAAGFSLSVASFSYHGKRDTAPQRLRRGRGVVAAAEECGVGVVVLGSPQQPAGTMDGLVEEARELLAVRGDSGPVLAWEYEPGTVLSGMDDLMELLERLESPHIAANMDIGHVWITERDISGPLERCAGRVAHMHIEDIAGDAHIHLAPGEGDLDWVALRRWMDDCDYRGPMVIDLFDLPAPPWKRMSDALKAARELLC